MTGCWGEVDARDSKIWVLGLAWVSTVLVMVVLELGVLAVVGGVLGGVTPVAGGGVMLEVEARA